KLHSALLQERRFLSQLILSRRAGFSFWYEILLHIPSTLTSLTFESVAVLPPLGGYLLQDSLVFFGEPEDLFAVVCPLQNLGLCQLRKTYLKRPPHPSRQWRKELLKFTLWI